MTNKTEDRFYFGKHGQKAKFGSDTRAVNRQARMWLTQANRAGPDEGLEQFHARLMQRLSEIIGATDALMKNPQAEKDYGGWSYDELEKELLSVAPHSNVARRWLQNNLRGGRFSRPGQPEKFGNAERLESLLETVDQNLRFGNPKTARQLLKKAEKELATDTPARLRDYMRELAEWVASEGFSRPGQPERFDASSLNRGNFAEASSSPMLGKLLSEKQMPEGGWRAVETGGGALVISFEDGDVAGNFARRVAGSGYSATAPVQSIGRYWNVEVKNG